MKTEIPTAKLNESVLGIRIERMSDGYVEARRKQIAMAHRNDFCICILPDKGNGKYFVDFNEVILNPGSLLFLYPGQISRVLATNNIDGWILYFENQLIDDYSRSVLEESLYHGPVLELSNDQKQWLLQLMELLHAASELRDMSSFHKQAMRSIAMSFIYKLTAIYQTSATVDMKRHSARSAAIVSSFRKLLRENYKEIKSPQEYANLMNLSLGYLNDTLKTVTGNTVSYSIHEEAIREAQRLLCYSDKTIKEISDTVGFDDPKYFSRTFSKVTGRPPAEFRKNYRSEQ